MVALICTRWTGKYTTSHGLGKYKFSQSLSFAIASISVLERDWSVLSATYVLRLYNIQRNTHLNTKCNTTTWTAELKHSPLACRLRVSLLMGGILHSEKYNPVFLPPSPGLGY